MTLYAFIMAMKMYPLEACGILVAMLGLLLNL